MKGEPDVMTPEKGPEGLEIAGSTAGLKPQGRSLGYQHTSLFTRGELYWDLSIHHYSLPFSVDLGSPHSPVGCCCVLCAFGVHSLVGRDELPTLSLLSVGVQASGHLLLPWSSKKFSSQVGSLTPPADSPGVSAWARIATEIPCSSCTGIFSSDRWDWFFSASHQAGSSASSQPGSAARTWPAQDNRGCLQCPALAAGKGSSRLCSGEKQHF